MRQASSQKGFFFDSIASRVKSFGKQTCNRHRFWIKSSASQSLAEALPEDVGDVKRNTCRFRLSSYWMRRLFCWFLLKLDLNGWLTRSWGSRANRTCMNNWTSNVGLEHRIQLVRAPFTGIARDCLSRCDAALSIIRGEGLTNSKFSKFIQMKTSNKWDQFFTSTHQEFCQFFLAPWRSEAFD